MLPHSLYPFLLILLLLLLLSPTTHQFQSITFSTRHHHRLSSSQSPPAPPPPPPSPTSFLQVLTDIDDTLKSSGGLKVGEIALGGLDTQYQRGVIYPGGTKNVRIRRDNEAKRDDDDDKLADRQLRS